MFKNTDEIMNEIRESIEEKFTGWQMKESELKAKLIGVGNPLSLAEQRDALSGLINLYDEIIDYYDQMQQAFGLGGETADKVRNQKLELQQILALVPEGE
jgi:hypothetical protein